MCLFQRKEKRDIFYMELLSESNFHFIRLNGVWWVVRVSLKINICYLFGTGSKLGKSEELGLKLDFPHPMIPGRKILKVDAYKVLYTSKY